MRWRHALLAVLLLLAATGRAGGSPLWLYSVHHDEEVRLEVGAATLSRRAWRSANHFFRSRKTQRRRTVHPRLLRTLAHIQRHFGNRRIEIISGYRTPASGDELNSYHQVGRAADVKLVGVAKDELLAYCRTLERIGCGYYPKAEFVHIDVRGASALWVDRSAPGKPRDYAPDARAWLRAHGL